LFGRVVDNGSLEVMVFSTILTAERAKNAEKNLEFLCVLCGLRGRCSGKDHFENTITLVGRDVDR
jgi:hypothetical protein